MVPGTIVVGRPSHELLPTDVDNTTSQTPPASVLTTIGNAASEPVKFTATGTNAPLSSTTPLSNTDPVESVSNGLNVPRPTKTSSSCTMSTGGAGVKVTLPALPNRGTISTKMFTPKVSKPPTSPSTTRLVVSLGWAVKLTTDKMAREFTQVSEDSTHTVPLHGSPLPTHDPLAQTSVAVQNSPSSHGSVLLTT